MARAGFLGPVKRKPLPPERCFLSVRGFVGLRSSTFGCSDVIFDAGRCAPSLTFPPEPAWDPGDGLGLKRQRSHP